MERTNRLQIKLRSLFVLTTLVAAECALAVGQSWFAALFVLGIAMILAGWLSARSRGLSIGHLVAIAYGGFIIVLTSFVYAFRTSW
jgi:hypothetical protein